jgi:hypothetical protein
MRLAVFVFLAVLGWFFWFAPRRPFAPVTPLPRQIHELVYGDAHRNLAALWLVALGVPRLAIADGGKYAAVFERESEYSYRVPIRNASPAILVSRYQGQRLPRFRSLYDRRALAAYVQWANRPEAAGFRWVSRRRAEVRADLGPDDVILVRRFAAGWAASVPTHRDPIGYLVLDPGRTGWVTITLTAPVFEPQPLAFPEHPVPEINPGGIVRFPNRVVTIYGHDLAGPAGPTRVLLDERPAEVLWAGPYQVNTRLPAAAGQLVVDYAGSRTDPVELGP